MSVIIKSPFKGKENWSGKEFSSLPAKIYSDFADAVSALNSYCFYKFDKEKCEYIEQDPDEIIREMRIIHLTGKKQDVLLLTGKIRW